MIEQIILPPNEIETVEDLIKAYGKDITLGELLIWLKEIEEYC